MASNPSSEPMESRLLSLILSSVTGEEDDGVELIARHEADTEALLEGRAVLVRAAAPASLLHATLPTSAPQLFE